MSEKSHVISTLVEHKPGVLQNVAGLLNRRGFNIDSITVGTSEVEGLARMVFVVKGDEKVLEQVIKQLHKLVDVVKIKDLDPDYVLKRELCFLSLHGFLHIMGYDHIEKADEEKMMKFAKEILSENGVER